MNYRREVDGLRALAVIPVILFHAGFATFSGGFVGVDVFFVISGYLITTILIAELERGEFSVVAFYERRARRILPALFLVMAASLPLAWLLLAPSDLTDFWQSLVAVSLFSSNVLFWLESGYFDTEAELKPLLHTWSLAVEEQFYILFPLLLMLAWPIGRRRIVAIILLVVTFSLALAQWGSARQPAASFFLLPTRAWELGLGALVAFLLARTRLFLASSPANDVLAMAGLLLILVAAFAFDERTPFPGLYALLPTVGTALVLLFAGPRTLAGRVLGSRVLVAVGLVSYSAYLWHQPMFAFARHASLGEPAEWQLLGLAALSLALAYVSWRFVEQPFRQKGTLSRRQVFAFAVVGSSLFICIGMTAYLTGGFETARMNAAQRSVLSTAASSPRRKDCHTGGAGYRKPSDSCEYHFAPATWAVFGDSHAVELAYAFAEELKESGAGVRQLSFSGCAPTFGRESADRPCSAWTREAIDYILGDPNISNVVVTYRVNGHLFGSHEGIYPRLPAGGTDSDRELVWKSYVDMLQRLVDGGKHVALVLQAPELAKPVESLVLKSPRPRNVAGMGRDWWNLRSRFVRERLHQIPRQVFVIDPTDLFCDKDTCLAVRDGVSLYFDDDHMSVRGARVVAAEVVKALGRGR